MAEASTTDDTAAMPAPIAPVLFKARGKGKGKANMRKRSPSPPPARDSDSDSDSDGSSDGGARGTIRDTKRRRKNGAGVISASTDVPGKTTSKADWQQPAFVTDRKALLAESDSATKQEQKVDSGPVRKLNKDGVATGPAPTPGSSAMAGVPQRSVGPVKAPTNIRTVTVTDYSPDVCKDYKQTGFCGFGDNCKFLHMREDYKQGWQLDNEWEAVTKGKKNLGGTIVASAANRGKASKDEEEEDEDEQLLRDIPFACIICRESYKQPIVTRCGHYFCERCALTRYRRDPSCAACGVATTGVFNTAKRLTKLLDRKRQRAAKRRQEAIEAGEEPSSDEEAEDSD
ncbi:pre-mrna splicing factor cwc24 [Ophiostoma piceae UAMH 11346]|uniref:Pre-mRNA-splicing factor CWC24 n=1 Tax=Ophiostoma piceae (strain UAMH 11346) TaxID=1262450 RepID=S3BVM1_OPHP1|nr:pre-mrna splicing factor cwc24 [Ophiostoma piceae UAMH 11346]